MSTSTPTSAPSDLNLKNIQGDILSGFPKKRETFYFFEVLDATKFREDFRKLIPDIKNVYQVLEAREEICGHKKMHPDGPLCPFIGVNIGFSHFGFQKLGIDDSKLTDPAFLAGQRADAENLGDKGTKSKEGKFIPDWEEEFKQDIHGVMNIASNCPNRIHEQVQLIEEYFKVGTAQATMRKVTSICGNTRPKEHNGEEHFGFLDGISNPTVIGFDVDPPPGPAPVRAGVIIVGHDGDPNKAERVLTT